MRLAIAGAKGGCGRTTVALGLAGAFARTGTGALVVDADRQLPNLHVVAGVDREPTVAAVATGRDPAAVAQEWPVPGSGAAHEPGPVDDIAPGRVGVLPAPPTAASVDLPATLARLDADDRRVLVDCPPGAGPDVVDALSAADGVVVVTTDDEGSVESTAVTVEMAERLDVPVLGVLVTRRATIPDGPASQLDAPVLGAIPDVDTPLTAPAATEAYDDALRELRARHYGDWFGGGNAGERIPTGIGPVDESFDGGLPPGSIVALSAEPASQSELLLYELTTSRGTLYLSTERSEATLRAEIEASTAAAGNPTIRRLDDDPLTAAAELLADLPAGANLVIDPMNGLERADRSAYLDFLESLKRAVRGTAGIVVLHCLSGPSRPSNRSATEHAADAVFELRTTVEDGAVRTHLAVTKFRNDRAPAETITIPLDLTAGVAESG